MVKYNEAATLHDTASVENDIWIGIAKDKKACLTKSQPILALNNNVKHISPTFLHHAVGNKHLL